MKKINFLICLIFIATGITAQSISFTGTWTYKFGDDPEYAAPAYDDANWTTIETARIKWTKNELPKGEKFVWLRKKIMIPSALKNELDKAGALALSFGRIKQEDETYLNGKLIGKTISGDLKRVYLLNERDILWDKENTIAIRISHWGDICSVGEQQTIAAAKPGNVFILSSAQEGTTPKEPVPNNAVVYNCMVENKSVKTVNASIVASFYDFNNEKLSSLQKAINLQPGINKFDFRFQSPVPSLKITYTLSIPEYNYTGDWNAEYGYIDIKYKNTPAPIANKVKEYFSPALLSGQKIDGWLGARLKANKELRLYKVDETALLAGYINKPGVHPWIGEHAGKFLEAACNSYQNTPDPVLKIQIDRTAQQLIASQLSDGYLGTYEAASHWTSWDVWSHKYNIIGLLSYYQMSGFKPALLAAQKAGDLLCATFGTGQGQKDIIAAGTHVGMAATSVLDPMTDLYLFTGNKKYLDFCYYITASFDGKNGPRIITTLDSIGRVDKTANAKAYEMLSNLVGMIKLYRVTADKKFLAPVLAAWKDITENRLYITGTTSSFEHFQDNHVLPASAKDNMGEGCVTTTWLQLNYNLLCIFGKMEYVNELERTVYNHLTGAENPQTGCVSYYTPLMGKKGYGCNITCCMSSVPRGIAMVPLFTNGKINGDPSFLFYQPGVYTSTLSDAKKTRVEFATKTIFPEDGNVTIQVNPSSATAFEIALRKPYWAQDFTVKVNGIAQKKTANDILLVRRTWKKGDVIAVSFSMPVKLLDGNISYPGSVAFQRGPQVLVYDKTVNTIAAGNINITSDFKLQNASPVLPKNWIGTQAYRVNVIADGKPENIILVPYADASQAGGEVTTWLKKN